MLLLTGKSFPLLACTLHPQKFEKWRNRRGNATMANKNLGTGLDTFLLQFSPQRSTVSINHGEEQPARRKACIEQLR